MKRKMQTFWSDMKKDAGFAENNVECEMMYYIISLKVQTKYNSYMC